ITIMVASNAPRDARFWAFLKVEIFTPFTLLSSRMAHFAVAPLIAVSVWILISGLDDLFITLLYCFTGRSKTALPTEAELAQAPERRIAILVPLWKEDRVIGPMLERNLSVLRYSNF